MGVVKKIYVGKDDVVRAVELRTGKGINLERAIQHLYPLELYCDVEEPKQLNAEAKEFRPTRNAAAIARIRIQDEAAEADD